MTDLVPIRRALISLSDKSGLDALTMAKRVRRTLKQLERRGRVSDQLEDQIHALNARGDLHPDALPRAPTDMLRARA